MLNFEKYMVRFESVEMTSLNPIPTASLQSSITRYEPKEDLDARRKHQADLAIRMKAGEKEAKDQLFKENRGYCIWLARKYQNLGVPFCELRQEAYLGLLSAMEDWDYRRSLLWTYAHRFVRGNILRAIGNANRTSGAPSDTIEDYRTPDPVSAAILNEKITKVQGALGTLDEQERAILERTYNLDQAPVEIGLSLGIHERKVRRIRTSALTKLQTSLSLRPFAKTEIVVSQAEADRMKNMLTCQQHRKRKERTISFLQGKSPEAQAILNKLMPRDKEILELRFGLKDGVNRSAKQVAEMLKIPFDLLRSYETHALKRFHNVAKS